MAAGDLVQFQGASSGGATASSIIVTLPAAVSSGNTVLIGMSSDSQPNSVPTEFTLASNAGGNFIYSGRPAGQSSWTFSFPDVGPIACVVTEHVGSATFTGPTYLNSTSAGTTSVGPSVASTAGDILLDYCFIGNQPTVGSATAWSNGYTAVGQSSTNVTGAFNFDVAMATKTSAGTASSTTATFDIASQWTHFQMAGTFSGGSSGTPPPTPKHVVFRIDAGETLVPINVTSL